MRITDITAGIQLFIGQAYESNTLAISNGSDILLIDALGSRTDAERLRRIFEVQQKRVRLIVSTHYFSDHMAALGTFPDALIVAHRNYRETFDSERYRTPEEAEHFVEPSIIVDDTLSIRWGNFTVDLAHAPAHTAGTVSADIREADLIHVGDTVVGNIVYFAYNDPAAFPPVLRRLRRQARRNLLSSHGDVRDARAIDHAFFYLDRFERIAREALDDPGREQSLLDTPLESCLPDGVAPSAFERIFHRRNLETVLQRRDFSVAGDASSAPARSFPA